MRNLIREFADRTLAGGTISTDEALKLSECNGSDLFFLMAEAGYIREKFVGNDVTLCSIINAKSGRCPENCAFCAQSAHHTTSAQTYPLVDEEKLLQCAKEAESNGASCYGIITSGTGINNGDELEHICSAVKQIKSETGINPSCSLGIITFETAQILQKAGVVTYHHNLETSRTFFPNICTTHNYEDDVNTVRVVKQAGLKVCSGGIFGLGETMEQRIELLMTLKELQVDSIPVNFLDPIEGTKLADADFLTPLECLKTIAISRFLLPDKQIKICGGREKNLRELQSMIFMSGASGMMTGNYLTKLGRNPETDRTMIKDLGLSIADCGCTS